MGAVNSLGYINVASGGAPVRITDNETTPAARVGAQTVRLQALPGNEDIVFVGTAGLVISTGVGVLGVIPPPADPVEGPFAVWEMSVHNAPAAINLADIYIDCASADGAVVGSYTEG
jgi:hypothetical protein